MHVNATGRPRGPNPIGLAGEHLQPAARQAICKKGSAGFYCSEPPAG